MSLVELVVPVAEATGWQDFEPRLGTAAEALGTTFLGSEEVGSSEVYTFEGHMSVEQLRELTTRLLPDYAPRFSLELDGDHRLVVTLPREQWILPLGSSDHPYLKEVKRLAKLWSADPELASWWQKSGFSRLEFHQASITQGTGSVFDTDADGDLLVTAFVDNSILNDERPARSEVTAVAAHNLRAILEDSSTFLGVPLPKSN